MLPSKNRLTLSFGKSLKGKRIEVAEFKVVLDPKKGILKATTIVSKKVAKKAVDRNRIKRLISESIRQNLEKINFEGSLVFIVKKNIAGLKKNQIEDKILKLITKI